MAKSEMEQLWDLQGRQAELRRHVLQLSSQLNSAERERSVIDVTVREMDAMPDNTTVYMGLGKMFVLTERGELRRSLLTTRNESLTKDNDRRSLREQFINKLKEGETKIYKLADSSAAAPHATIRRILSGIRGSTCGYTSPSTTTGTCASTMCDVIHATVKS